MFQATTTRRGFLVGCSSAIAAMAGARLSYAAFASPDGAPNQETLVVVFLRGGCDGLNIVLPIGGADREHYESARRALRVTASGVNAAIPLGGVEGSDVAFGLHPGAAPLSELYQAGKLAVIHAAGLTSDTRSHFDAMEFMERGTPGNKSTQTGWLTRHLQSATNLPTNAIVPSLSVGNLTPSSQIGNTDLIGMNDPYSFSFWGNWRYVDQQRSALRHLYGGDSWLHQAGIQTLDAVDTIEARTLGDYTPANGAEYPNDDFGQQMQLIAQIIKGQLGLRVATVDLGGWDTHEYQGDSNGGYFSDQLNRLSRGLHALYTDLNGAGAEDHTKNLTVVVMSEFGRRLQENNSRGTDHGHGNVMFALGGNVNGGRIFGPWPGLHAEQLYDGRDLAITTDYRRVLSEILIRRLGNAKLGQVFPGYRDYTPLGVFNGADIEPDYGNPIPVPTSHSVYLPTVVR